MRPTVGQSLADRIFVGINANGRQRETGVGRGRSWAVVLAQWWTPPMRECFSELPPIGWRWLGLYIPEWIHHWMWVTQGKRGNLKGPNTELLLLTALPTAETCLLAVHHSGRPSLVCSEFPALNQSVCPKNGVHELICIFLWLGWDWMVCCQPHLKHVKLVPHKKKVNSTPEEGRGGVVPTYTWRSLT